MANTNMQGQQFTLFPALPDEIKLMIWREAYKATKDKSGPRIFLLGPAWNQFPALDISLKSGHGPLGVWSANVQSRQATFLTLNPIPGLKNPPGPVFDPERDTIQLCYTMCRQMDPFYGRSIQVDSSTIRFDSRADTMLLALRTITQHLEIDSYYEDWSLPREWIPLYDTLTYFPNLRTVKITVVYQEMGNWEAYPIKNNSRYGRGYPMIKFLYANHGSFLSADELDEPNEPDPQVSALQLKLRPIFNYLVEYKHKHSEYHIPKLGFFLVPRFPPGFRPFPPGQRYHTFAQ